MNLAYKFCLYMSAQGGNTVLALAVLAAALAITGSHNARMIEAFLGLAILRLGFFYFKGPQSLLTGLMVRKRPSVVAKDELLIGMIFIAMSVLMIWHLSRMAAVVFLVSNLILQLAWMHFGRLLMRRLVRYGRTHAGLCAEKQTIVVGTGPRARRVAEIILRSPELQTTIVGFLDFKRENLWRYRDIPLLGHPDDLVSLGMKTQIDAVIIATEPEDLQRTRGLFASAEQMGVTICVMPDIYESSRSRPQPMWINGTSTYVYRAVPENKLAQLAKMTMDKLGALFGLLLAAPIMIASAIAIKLDSRGPVLFKQKRSGLNGKIFDLYKFRTMCNDAERLKEKLKHNNEMSGPVFKMTDDPRVTPIGRILRRFSIDELPQFINVLRGEMSLVGPRPPLPKEVAEYKPWHRRRLSVKPGVTCTWQVSGRNRIDFEDWMRLDLEYIDNWSLWEDTKIIARTVPAVLKGDGAS